MVGLLLKMPYQMIKDEIEEVKSVVRSSKKMDANIGISDSLKVHKMKMDFHS